MQGASALNSAGKNRIEYTIDTIAELRTSEGVTIFLDGFFGLAAVQTPR
jgi:hypothetical protein